MRYVATKFFDFSSFDDFMEIFAFKIFRKIRKTIQKSSPSERINKGNELINQLNELIN